VLDYCQMHKFSAIKLGLCGGLGGVVTDFTFYSLDSYKIIKQAKENVKISKLFKGAISLSILGSGPSFGIFFLMYAPIRDAINIQLGGNNDGLAVTTSSIISTVPSSIIYVPADVIKKRVILGEFPTVYTAFIRILRREGSRGLFLGWRANLLRDIPFGIVKMGLYESLSNIYISLFAHKRLLSQSKYNAVHPSSTSSSSSVMSSSLLTQTESGIVGATSGAATAVITCPIDCVNTRIKSGEYAHLSVTKTHLAIVRNEGVSALFRGVGPRIVLYAAGSSLFWYTYASFRVMFDV